VESSRFLFGLHSGFRIAEQPFQPRYFLVKTRPARIVDLQSSNRLKREFGVAGPAAEFVPRVIELEAVPILAGLSKEGFGGFVLTPFHSDTGSVAPPVVCFGKGIDYRIQGIGRSVKKVGPGSWIGCSQSHTVILEPSLEPNLVTNPDGGGDQKEHRKRAEDESSR
jgi:hypothetical protein